MRPSAAEALKAAIRRSLPIAAVLVILGIVVVNAFQQVRGPRYAAGASVFHSTTDIGAILTDIQPSFVDPDRVIETALALARSPEVYDRAARSLAGNRSADELRGATTVTGDDASDVIEFSTTLDDPDEAVRTVNAVAGQYIAWRSEIFGQDIARAIERIEARLGRSAVPSDPANADLQEQLNRLRTLEALHSGGAVLTERATEAPQVSPSPIRDSVLGASFGFVIALLVAGLREAFNTRIRSEADIEDALRRPVLATIETLPKRAGLVTVGRHESRYGDTYALLAANVMQIRGGRSPTILAITSAIAGEGKTTTASNLAVAMAQRGQRVVLADFDLRKPSVGRIFRIPSGAPGVVQLVDGDADLAQAVWSVPLNGALPTDVVRPVLAESNGRGLGSENGHGSLRVVASGGNERGARVARSPRVPELLASLGSDADIVILDTPPALATVEMAELSRTVDVVLVVVRHSRVTRRSLVTLNRQAEGWRSEILGAVLVDAPPEEDDYYYYKG
jgi:Mrp family chromosome partitioning ATPase